MEINPHIFRGYDIRGEVDKDLNLEVVELIGKAHGTYLKSIGVDKAVVGSDNRLSSDGYRDAVIAGLKATGTNVIDLGTCTSPLMYWSQYHFESKGGVMITGSHNPVQYNGFKLGKDYSDSLTPIDQIKEMVISKKFAEGVGSVTKADQKYVEEYNKDLLSKVGKLKKMKVVVDTANSTPGKFIPELLRQAGMEVIEQNCELDGSFPSGTPDPTEEFLAKRIAERVVKEKADVGFSFDSDGDRLGIVDEKGGIIWNDVLVAIFADDVINQNPGASIVYNALCSKIVTDVITNADGKGVMWLTGHAFIKDKAHQVSAKFAGELSGHFYFLDKFYGHDDGSYAALRLLDYLTRKEKTLSEVVASFPKYISSPEVKIGCADDKKEDVVSRMVGDFERDFGKENVNKLDGARVDFPDGMMIVRFSQNGPYLTVKFEAKDEKKYEERREYIKKLLRNYPEIDWSFGVNAEQIK
jgi:phosphomannomutase/phosphoglucomutase